MSENSNSINLSEFFNDNDSEGHRFVEYIEKRRGAVKKQNFIFMDYEPERFSIDVKFEKLPTSQNKKNCNIIENPKENEKSKQNLIGKDSLEYSVLPNLSQNHSVGPTTAEHSNELILRDRDCLPQMVEKIIPVSTISSALLQNTIAKEKTFEKLTNASHANSKKVVNVLQKGSGVSPGDRLRRYSLRNRTKLPGGRRTLLQEFESTIGDQNFEPPVCSTPIIRPQTEKQHHPLSNNQTPENENVEPNNAVRESCCEHTDTIIRTLLRKDQELNNYAQYLNKTNCQSKESCEINIDKTKTNTNCFKSPLKRTYTIEKGNTVGQVILTPDKSISEDNYSHSNLPNLQMQSSHSKILKLLQNCSARKNNSTLQTIVRANSPHCPISENRSKTSLSNEQQQKTKENTQIVANSLQKSNLSILFPTQCVEIPGSQDQMGTSENSIAIRSNVGHPMVVINQTCGTLCRGKMSTNNNNSLPKDLSKHHKLQAVDKQKLAEDCLKQSDIFTDDEDIANSPSTKFPQNNSLRPLNLRTTRHRKRLSTRKLQIDYSQQQSVQTTIEPPPQAHTKTRLSKIKHIPLNRAPGIPLNGEEYAQELRRMSNYEILDLRKRNSMGQVFVISGRKSRRSERDIKQKRNLLDEQIELELQKRNLEKPMDTLISLVDQPNVESELCKNFPVPYDFRDSTSIVNESLINEKSSDRVKFKNNIKSKGQKAKTRNKPIPKVLMNYLKVSNRKRKSVYNNSRRTLFPKELHLSDDHISCENTHLTVSHSSSIINNISIPVIKSPPKTNGDLIHTPKIVSPPPPVSTSHQNSVTKPKQSSITSEIADISNYIDITENLALPPPPGFESLSSNNQYTTNTTVTASEADTGHITALSIHGANNEDNLFKKPDKPAPKKIVKNKKKSSTNEIHGESQQSNTADFTEGGTLRRSKRDKVPYEKAPILKELYEQMLKRSTLSYEKRKQHLQNKKNSKCDKTVSSQKSRTSSKKKQPTITPEKVSRNCDPQNTSLMDKRKVPQPNGDIERCNSTQSPSAVHADKVFDHLKTQNSLTNTQSQTAESQLKTKSLKICLRRLKSPAIQQVSHSSSNSSSVANKTSNMELISLLKNIGQVNVVDPPFNIDKEMRISSASCLSFTEIHGLEYAFYDTDDKGSLGYLRFKPRQIKAKKRAKHFHLHFINLMGTFLITANNKESLIGVGDMVAIEKSVYYEIENTTDDTGILMVIKR